ncbi:MAG: hypothetical protein KC456_01980 [Flavobacteriales bacterium]|nr:hypothetical protein [Flavobacteriales bacterium]
MQNAYSQDLFSDFLNSEETKLQQEIEMTNDKVGPSEWTIQKILGFSKSLQIQKSSLIGDFEQFSN